MTISRDDLANNELVAYLMAAGLAALVYILWHFASLRFLHFTICYWHDN